MAGSGKGGLVVLTCRRVTHKERERKRCGE